MSHNNAARNQVFASLDAQRHSAELAARPAFETMRASDRAAELMARMQAAKLTKNRDAWEAARAELMTLVEQL